MCTAGSSSDGLDPAKYSDAFSAFTAGAIYDTLVRVDGNLNLSAHLASDFSSSPDAAVWTFRIRDGVKFHDGRPCTSADVAYSINRVLQPKTLSGGLGGISPYLNSSGISTPDKTTLKLTLHSANAFLPQQLALLYFGIVPEGSTTFGIGTAAFKLKSFSGSLQNLTVEKFDDYWIPGLPYLDGIVMTCVADDATRVEALVSGQADAVIAVPPTSVGQLTGKVKPLPLKTGVWYNMCALKQGVFKSPLVIEALKYAQDRKTILDLISPSVHLIAADIPVPPGDEFYPAGLQPRPYDPEKAKGLLKQAGYPDGINVQLWGYPGPLLDEAVAFKSTAAPAGIQVSPMSAPHPTYFDVIWLHKPFVTDDWPRLHASVALTEMFFHNAGDNECDFDDPHFEDVVNAAFKTSNVTRQKTLLGDALEIVNNTAGSFAPGWAAYYFGVKANLEGIFATEAGGVNLFMDKAYYS
jgi:peptide/nickel transport system substrate-binding protein